MLTKNDRNETLNRKFIDVKLNDKNIRMQLDTESDIPIIDKKTWKAIGKPFLDLTRKVAQSVCDKLILRGQITLNVPVNGKLAKAKV